MLTAVVLARNEEQNLKDCLAGLKWVDRLLVIDDESEDKTVEVARKLGAEVVTHPLNGDFAGQRNFALSQIEKGWVLFVDADERVSEDLSSEIRRKINEASSVKGYIIPRADFFFGQELKHGETGGAKFLRLARKGSGEWQRKVHEVWQIDGPTATLQSPLKHYPHQSITEFLLKINHYSTLHAVALYKEGEVPVFWKVILYPAAKFCQNWLGRLGFLDGSAGMVIAMMMSFHSFLARAKLYMLYRSGAFWKIKR